jgi:hypothetical protein
MSCGFYQTNNFFAPLEMTGQRYTKNLKKPTTQSVFSNFIVFSAR